MLTPTTGTDVTIRASDGTNTSTLQVTVFVTNVLHDADELPVITGTARVGETMTVDTSPIPDTGQDTTFGYLWIRTDGDTDTNIDGATSFSYTLTDNDEGKTIKVLVGFRTTGGRYRLTSAPTEVVVSNSDQQPINIPATGVPTISAPNNICDRPQAVQDAIRTALDQTHLSCEQVPVHSSDFVTITHLTIRGVPLPTSPSGSFYGLIGLESLEISTCRESPGLRYCGLDELPADIFDDLSRLRVLDLSRNDLEELPEGIFDGLDNLETLYLGRNELTALHQDVFDGLSSLKELGLDHNDLSSLPRRRV